MGNKLENLLNFEDFEKNWKSKDQKSTKRTEVGLDVLNENLYMKVMDQTAAGWKENVDKFVKSIKSAVNQNQVKDIEVKGETVSFKIRTRPYKINKEEGSVTLMRDKTTSFREKKPDSAGRMREERKRKKIREKIEVKVPIGKTDAVNIYNALKERVED